jgi:hypothetical protein
MVSHAGGDEVFLKEEEARKHLLSTFHENLRFDEKMHPPKAFSHEEG